MPQFPFMLQLKNFYLTVFFGEILIPIIYKSNGFSIPSKVNERNSKEIKEPLKSFEVYLMISTAFGLTKESNATFW